MHDALVLANSAFAILMIVFLIIYVKVNPLIALVIGPLYLGLSSGIGFDETIKAITTGFGDLMARIGLLIGFGVMIGAFMDKMGVFQHVAELIMTRLRKRQVPFAFATILCSIFPPIYTDVLLVISAPLAKMLARNLGPNGLPMMAAAVGVGMELALVIVVPGVAALALSAVLEVDLGTMLIYGLMVAIPTAIVTLMIYAALLKMGLWDVERDQLPADEDPAPADPAPEHFHTKAPLAVSLLPVLVPIIMIAIGAINRAFDLESPILSAMGNSTFALLIGLIIAFLVGKRYLPIQARKEAVSQAFRESGQILLLTGVAGSLSEVVGLTDLGGILSGYFSAGGSAPLLLVWLVACVLHIAIGSVSVSAITAASLLAPVASQLDVEPVWIALAAGSGSLFLIHVTSNTFWLMQTLMHMTLRGTLKTFSLAVSIASFVSLAAILILSSVF
ncbi:GntP family permease [Paracoccus marinaquae]|uniref:GntP family permease n=1 Tax=Paracoccus marinaquae TaxID=2841926 RepID=A0ABS6ARV1_9RHOB|nr:SLC13 family permease [Paracoccus marinaquae]MBU3032335.1 GntP family permease [Paracoccus marinaquae]